jgi:competence ComEA-like helix-hairpin-helix protein
MKNKFILIFITLLLCTSNAFAIEKIDINTANLQQLDQIIGVGPVTAQKIIDARPYSSIDDLLRVKGIGPATLQKIKEQGIVCIDCLAVIPPPSTAVEARNDVPIIPIVPIIYPSGIILNEILPSPEGADEENEFIEIYNSNSFDIDLSGWKIKDTTGTITTFTIPSGTIILTNKYLVFKRPQTKISLNNTGDTINLILPNDKIIDSITFTKAPLNQSYSKIDSIWSWSTTLTPALKNIISVPTSKDSATSINTAKSINDNLASLNNSLDLPPSSFQNNYSNINPLILFFIVLSVAIISAIAILIFKIKLSKTSK